MSKPERGNAASTDIDVLLRNTWLQVINSHHGPQFRGEEGYTLWQRCVADVERVQHELEASGLDDASYQHILIAQCTLLDETVRGRGVEDEACLQWYDIPLQGHFLGTMDAGNALCKRMRDVLRESAPDLIVVTCFQRVMLLDFVGSFRSLNDPERLRLINALSEHVPPFQCPSTTPILVENRVGLGVSGWLASWPVRIDLSVVVVLVLRWGLNHWLDHLLLTLLPGMVR